MSYLSRIFLLSLFVPFICVFLGHLKNTQTSVQDRIGLLYQSSQVPPYVAVLNAVALCKLTLSTLGNVFSTRHIKIFFLLFPENRI